MEMQKREMMKRAAANFNQNNSYQSGGFNSNNSYSSNSYSNSQNYSSSNTGFSNKPAASYSDSRNQPSFPAYFLFFYVYLLFSPSNQPMRKGMQLGHKNKELDLLDSIKAEEGIRPQPPAQSAYAAPQVSPVQRVSPVSGDGGYLPTYYIHLQQRTNSL
jgi:hypothetical protein